MLHCLDIFGKSLIILFVNSIRIFLIVEISWDENYLMMIIDDDGDGFKNEILDQIGQPYISKHSKGMGLGIFIAKNLIENMGGSISFKNKKERGASVEIKIKRVI